MNILTYYFNTHNLINCQLARPPPLEQPLILLNNKKLFGGFRLMEINVIGKFKEMLALRNLSAKTTKKYLLCLRNYMSYVFEKLEHKSLEDVSWDEIRSYITYLSDEKKISPRTINGYIAQLRFLHLYVLGKPWDRYQIPYKKFNSTLPYVPAMEEVREFINGTMNLKRKAMFALMYSSGLRVSEVCRLRYEDVSRSKMNISVKETKNRSDTVAALSPKALDILTEYWKSHGKPRGWLFPGKNGSPVKTETVRRYVQIRLEELGWDKEITCRTLRTAYGTHLYGNGADLPSIQVLLRHKSINSTRIYVILSVNGSKIPESPFDSDHGGNE